MAQVEIYSTLFCPYCARAKSLLGKKGVEYVNIDVMEEPARRDEMVSRAGGRGLPCGSYRRMIRSVSLPLASFRSTRSSTCSIGTVRPLMDCVVTMVWEPFAVLVCEIVGPSATTFPLTSTALVLLTLDCWAVRHAAKANPANRQFFTIPG